MRTFDTTGRLSSPALLIQFFATRPGDLGNTRLTRNAGYPCVRVVKYLAVRACETRSLGATPDRDSAYVGVKVGASGEKR